MADTPAYTGPKVHMATKVIDGVETNVCLQCGKPVGQSFETYKCMDPDDTTGMTVALHQGCKEAFKDRDEVNWALERLVRSDMGLIDVIDAMSEVTRRKPTSLPGGG